MIQTQNIADDTFLNNFSANFLSQVDERHDGYTSAIVSILNLMDAVDAAHQIPSGDTFLSVVDTYYKQQTSGLMLDTEEIAILLEPIIAGLEEGDFNPVMKDDPIKQYAGYEIKRKAVN